MRIRPTSLVVLASAYFACASGLVLSLHHASAHDHSVVVPAKADAGCCAHAPVPKEQPSEPAPKDDHASCKLCDAIAAHAKAQSFASTGFLIGAHAIASAVATHYLDSPAPRVVCGQIIPRGPPAI